MSTKLLFPKFCITCNNSLLSATKKGPRCVPCWTLNRKPPTFKPFCAICGKENNRLFPFCLSCQNNVPGLYDVKMRSYPEAFADVDLTC